MKVPFNILDFSTAPEHVYGDRRPRRRPGRAPRDRLAAPRRSNSNAQKPYWVNPKGGKIFCVVEADSAADAYAVHREAHGLVADAIYEVEQG